jgi:hypothetical protein
MSAVTETQTAASPPTAAQTERRKRAEKFPLKYHFAITVAMGNSLRRLTGSNSLLSESDIGRLALHSYLLANDPLYVKQLSNGHG